MTRRVAVFFVALALVAQTMPLDAQTTGGRCGLRSKTWTWTNQQQGVPQTTLFSPSVDSDFIITMYLSSTPIPPPGAQGGSNVCPRLYWTDDYGPQSSDYAAALICNAVDNGPPFIGNYEFPIHVKANTPVSLAITYSENAGAFTYTFILGKIRLNP